jgi:outer membrane protein TolC
MASWQTDAAQLPEGWAPLVAGTGSDQQGIRRDQYRVVLDVSQRIYDGGRSAAEKDVAKAQAETERRTVDVEMYALEGRIDDIFFGILLLEAQQEQLEKRIQILEENKRRCQVLVDNELALESDADAVEVEIVNANQAMTQLQYSADAYREMLSLLTGWRIEEGTLVMPDDILTLPTATRPDRPELQLMDAQLAYIDAQKRLLRTDSKPHFSFFALGWYGYPGLNMFEDMQSSRWSFNAIAGVRALWNVTSLFANRSINDQLYNRQQQIEVQRDIFTFNTSLQIKQEDREIARLQQTIQDDERIVTLRHSLRTAAESKYENGIVSITDVMNAVTDESLALSAQVLHQIELLKKKYELKHTTYAN